MSKPSASGVFLARWIVALGVLAAAAVIAAGPMSSHVHGKSTVAGLSSNPLAATAAARARISASFAALPLAFEENQGQTDPQVKYTARGAGYTLFLTSSDVVFSLHSAPSNENRRSATSPTPETRNAKLQRPHSAQTDAVVRMRLVGGKSLAAVSASDRVPGLINYYIGNDPKKWRTGVPQYGRVSYHDVYPGVNLAFHGARRQLEFDFVVAPGADARPIELGFSGARRIATDASGNLVLSSTAGDVMLQKPVAYQEKDGVRQPVNAGFVVKNNEVAFDLGSYDHSRELVIDPAVPALSYATYLGGSGEDDALAVAVDAAGSAYVTGQTSSTNFPGTITFNGGFDAFVSKLDFSGSTLTLARTTLIGGSGNDFGTGIALNTTAAYVVGNTNSVNFPLSTNIGPLGGQDVFVAQLDKTSLAPLHLTKIGGTSNDIGNAIAVDAAGNTYIGGETLSTDFPTVSPAIQSTNGGSDGGFVLKLNSTGTAPPLFSTYLGGSSNDFVDGIALDSAGTPTKVYVTGGTGSTDFPTTSGAFQTSNAGLDDAFVTAIKADGSAPLVYSTYLGGSGHDGAFAIAVDSAGEAYVTGGTPSSNFPTANAAQGSLGGGNDAFITKFNAAGSALVFSTFLGGTLDETGTGIALDSFNDVYVTGRTSSSNFPVSSSPFQGTLSGTTDAFVTELSNTGSVEYSSFLGGSGTENSLSGSSANPALGAVTVDSTSNAYLVGNTNSTDFPVKSPSQATNGGGIDAFVAKVGAAPADFSVAVSPSSVSVTSGQSTSTITVTVSSVNAAFGNPVTLSCSGKPSKAACNFSKTSATPGASPDTATLTISTNGTTGNGMLTPPMNRGSQLFYATLLPLGGLALLGVGFGSRRKKLVGFLLLGLTLLGLLMLPACGGGGSTPPPNNNTPPGTYTITVNGSAGGAIHGAQLTLKVN